MVELGKLFEMTLPGKVIFGRGSVERLGEEAARFGRRALLVTGRRSLRESGNLKRVDGILRKAGIEYNLFDGVESDPSDETVEAGVRATLEGECEVVIGIGGGSALDCGKAIAGIVANPGRVDEFWRGREFEKPAIPYIAVPTSSGTGSEVTSNAVLSNRREGFKKSIRGHNLIPRVAVVDPQLTLSLPPDVTAQTGMDALTQLIEPLVGRMSQPITDRLALYGIELVGRYLRRAVARGNDIEAREGMSLASLLGGICLLNAGLGAVHGLSHPIGAIYGIPHGLACAVLLPWIMELNAPNDPEKFRRIDAALGGSVRELMRDLNLPMRLRDLSVRREDFRRIAEGSKGGSRNNNPVPVTDEDLVKVLERAY
ncbi:MAG: iron-containing alcohol dehydrogenase family protein [bacterium]